MTIEHDTVSTTHPHEPSVPPVCDSDGRCLVCAIAYAAGELAREVARRPAGLRQIGWRDKSCTTEPLRILPMSVDPFPSDFWQAVYVVEAACDGVSPEPGDGA